MSGFVPAEAVDLFVKHVTLTKRKSKRGLDNSAPKISVLLPRGSGVSAKKAVEKVGKAAKEEVCAECLEFSSSVVKIEDGRFLCKSCEAKAVPAKGKFVVPARPKLGRRAVEERPFIGAVLIKTAWKDPSKLNSLSVVAGESLMVVKTDKQYFVCLRLATNEMGFVLQKVCDFVPRLEKANANVGRGRGRGSSLRRPASQEG